MNLYHLRYFVTLAHLEHYTKAADVLAITQPSLSHAISSLEEELGVKLFEKNGRNVSLTKYGKTFLGDVEETLNRLDSSVNGLQLAGKGEGQIDVAFLRTLGVDFVPKIIRSFLTANEGKQINFNLFCDKVLTGDILTGLKEKKYDIGFCSDLLKSDEIEYYPIRDSYIAVVVPKGHPLENRERISLKETAGYPQIMFSKTSGFRTLQEQIFAEEGIKVKPVCAAEEIEVITGLVENGFGISVLPYMDIVRLHNVVTIPVKTSGWNSKFYIARRKYGIRSEQEEAFFQHWKKEHH